VLALGLATWQAARMDALAFRREQGRSARVPFWKRYYLDLGLVVLCVAGYVELATFGSVVTRTQLNSQSGPTGGLGQASLIQLLAPTLMLIAGALLLQRVLPWLVRLGAWLATRGRGSVGMLAFAQVSRASALFSRLTLLLTLSVGLGLFALSFQTTIARGAQDNAYYLTGADERVSIKPQSEGTQSTLGYAALFARMPGVLSVSPMYRGVALTLPDQGGQNVDVLGVDPSTFAQTAAWRSDYASQSLPSLMRVLAGERHGASVGEAGQPMVALIDQTYANTFSLKVGARFQLVPQEAGEANAATSAYFVVGAIVNDFPTLYPSQYPEGFIVVSEQAFNQAVNAGNPNAGVVLGSNEFWALTDGDAAHEAAFMTYLNNHPELDSSGALSLRETLATAQSNPVSAGMRGLLLIGAVMAALLAVLGAIIQSALAARQRSTQFAVLRTLGVCNHELIQILLSEQSVVYVFGLVGGTALGALLVSATLPFLQFSDRPVDPALLGTPPYVLVTDPRALGIFYVALLVAFVVALLIAARYAATVGLGRALRLGED